ncbi:hypothetical protein RRG08_060282 [Elysia crispata]|uniref:Uncharacterized protein n=1 Tax=Elysia crispata TaxID=231223 RepID=A0AAE1DWS0_9GAST|nr:hypothetical protein RRG08_060282 [Elysia crispata]
MVTTFGNPRTRLVVTGSHDLGSGKHHPTVGQLSKALTSTSTNLFVQKSKVLNLKRSRRQVLGEMCKSHNLGGYDIPSYEDE